MVVRFDPFREFDRLTQDAWNSTNRRATATATDMPIYAYRSGDRFLVHFDLPGVDPSTVDLTVEKNVLTVRAERSPNWGADAELIVAERPGRVHPSALPGRDARQRQGRGQLRRRRADGIHPRGRGGQAPTGGDRRVGQPELHPHHHGGVGLLSVRLTTPPGAVRLPHRARPRP